MLGLWLFFLVHHEVNWPPLPHAHIMMYDATIIQSNSVGDHGLKPLKLKVKVNLSPY